MGAHLSIYLEACQIGTGLCSVYIKAIYLITIYLTNYLSLSRNLSDGHRYMFRVSAIY